MCTSRQLYTLCFSSRFLFNVVIIRHFNTVNTIESGYSQTWNVSTILIRWSLGIHSEIFTMLPRSVLILFEKAFIPAWTLEETESVLLNGTNKPRMQKRGDKEKSSQREGTHFKMCVINVRSLVSSIYSRCWSRPPCLNLIGSINLNQLVIQRQGERQKLKLRQLNAKLSQSRKQTQGGRELP